MRNRVSIAAVTPIVVCALSFSSDSLASVLYSASGHGLYYMVKVDVESGTVEKLPQPIPSTVGTVVGLAYDSENEIMYGLAAYTHYQLVRFDLITGAATVLAPLGYTGSVHSLAYDRSSGFLYTADTNARRLVRIDPATGDGSSVGTFIRTDSGATVRMYGLCFDAEGQLFGSGTSAVGQGIREFHEIDPSDAKTDFLSTATPASFVSHLAVDPADGLTYGAQNYTGGQTVSQVLRADLASGQTQVVADFRAQGFGYVDGLAFVPEPATLSLLALGGLALLRRRRIKHRRLPQRCDAIQNRLR